VLFAGPVAGCVAAVLLGRKSNGFLVAASLVGQALANTAFRALPALAAQRQHLSAARGDAIVYVRAVYSSPADYAWTIAILLAPALLVAGVATWWVRRGDDPGPRTSDASRLSV
jgi:hypothetical protein